MSGTTLGVAENSGGCSCSSTRADSVDAYGCVPGRVGLLLACSLMWIGEREGLSAGEWLSPGSRNSAAVEPRCTKEYDDEASLLVPQSRRHHQTLLLSQT